MLEGTRQVYWRFGVEKRGNNFRNSI